MSERFDFVIIGAGASGEAAASYARARGATVALVERDLFGGTCAFWGCMPSKTLLHAAEIRACGGDYPWEKASARRDYMIVREGRDYPDDSGHIKGYKAAGTVPVRGSAKIAGPGKVVVRTDDGARELEARDIVIAVGSVAKVPKIEGLAEAGFWTNKEGTSLRELPKSIAILGAGPSGTELAQVYGRFGVRTTLVSPRQVNPSDHPRSSALLTKALRSSGVDVRENARAERVRPRAGKGGDHIIELADGSTVEAAIIELNVGRTAAPALSTLGLDAVGIAYDGGDILKVDDTTLRAADHVYAIGDCVGHELSTHLGHYEGETAVKIALGDNIRADFSATPRAVYTDPETAAVGLLLDQAKERGIDAFEETANLATSAKGYVSESEGHVSIVIDRKNKIVVGAFIGGPAASEAIHEAVLAIKLRTPIALLAQTIHAFPTVSRAMGGLFVKADLALR
jgi:pyruvate/2-oxoglutarate dehydrogenase complex dihydrolipoamide dehydrogenase (E3) component